MVARDTAGPARPGPAREHPELSLAFFGATYFSLKLPDFIRPIPTEDLRLLLNLVTCIYDLKVVQDMNLSRGLVSRGTGRTEA